MNQDMKEKSIDLISDRLEEIGCWPIPATVRRIIDQEVDVGIAAAKAKIIRKKVTVEMVTRALRQTVGASAHQPELPGMPPPIPKKEEAFS